MLEILIGFDKQLSFFKEAFQLQTLSPGWLICGEQGLGKATFAHFVAAEIVPGFEKSVTKKLVFQNNHPNFFKLIIEDDKKEITVDQARELQRFLKGTPTIDGWRVVIIDSADSLNRQAANALLKVVEEPPLNTLLLLIVHKMGNVLPTIQSRCSKLMLSGVEEDDFKKALIHNNQTFHELLYALAEGKIGLYQRYCHEDVVFLWGDIGKMSLLALSEKMSMVDTWITSNVPTKYDIIKEILPKFFMRLLKSVNNEASRGMQQLLSMKEYRHWVKVSLILEDFLEKTKQSHISPKDALYGAFLLIQNPELKTVM